MTAIAAIDLFAGAGGLSLGAKAAGAYVLAHVDNDPWSCKTLRANPGWHTGEIVEADIRSVSGLELRQRAGIGRTDPLLVVGGAPCQPFSKAAYWIDAGDEAAYRRARARGLAAIRPAPPSTARPDDRRDLVTEFWRLVLETKADAFVFENVPSILHPRNRHLALSIVEAARSEGFKPTLVRANAVDFGVAQRRERIFIMAARSMTPDPPSPTHTLEPDRASGLLPAVTAGQAIRPYRARRYAELEEMVTGRWATHLLSVPPGWNYKAHTAWGGHPNPSFETETRFWSFLLKLHPDLPSWTIPANPGPWVGPFHWESRRLRTPELAALQGFPHGYKFIGDRRSRVRQIGNAVPPPLACKMVAAAVDAMSKRRRRAA
jgi:DNA (cytosine-5)-methyltransferase 1